MSLKHPAVARLQAELKVRTEMYPRDRNRPAEFCRRGYSSAYDTGFELAWRGRPIGSPYTQPHLRRAEQAGWFAGLAAAEREIARILGRTKNPRPPGNAESTPRAVEKRRRRATSE